MPWHLEAMKDVLICDKLRLGGKWPVIRRFPNGGTQPEQSGYLLDIELGANEGNWNI